MIELSDLHAHLGSMVSPRKLWEIAHEQGIKLPVKNYHKFIEIITSSKVKNHKQYLNKFNLTQKIQSSPLAIQMSIFDAISDAYINNNVTLLELRFNPMLRNIDGYFDLDMILTHATIGLQRASAIYPVKCGIIISTDRSFDEDKSVVLAKKAVKFKDKGIIGFDMSGHSHSAFNIKAFKKAFNIAKDGGLGVTIHTAEVPSVPLSETSYIMKHFSPDRFGHGINIVNDPMLLKEVADRGIHLEICPSSNVVTKCVSGYDRFKHIFSVLNEYNISYSINTDGTVFLNTSIPNEYEMLISHGVLSSDDIDKLEFESRNYSFL